VDPAEPLQIMLELVGDGEDKPEQGKGRVKKT
jgi:hypothetical protein